MQLGVTGTPAPNVDAPRFDHALGESDTLDSPHMARSSAQTRCPWFLSSSDKTLATEPFPLRMVGRFREAPIS
jgi:hypothetical protein